MAVEFSRATAQRQRVERLLEAARLLADPTAAAGQTLRRRLLASTGLSPAGIEFGIRHALELHPSDAEVTALCSTAPPAPRSWVVLSANVFVAAHRAIALGLASSPTVFVKPSRRDPVLAEALCEASRGLFAIVSELAPRAADHVYAYGSDSTMEELRRTLPEGVVLHAHGTGMGAALVTAGDDLAVAAASVAQDVALFDQRGCLSPRIVGVAKDVDGPAFAERLASALAAFEAKVPSGTPLPADLGERVWYREVSAYLGRAYPAGAGYVGYFEQAEQVPLPPAQRCVSVFSAADVSRCLAHVSPSLTVIATNDPGLQASLAELYPGARITTLGLMQSLPFDGPVDRRNPL